MSEILLKPGREKPLLRRHPWIYSGAVAEVRGDPKAGEPIAVLDSEGRFLARAGYSPSSQIRARVWTRDPEEQVNSQFILNRVQHA
ncbi:MAG: 23S rRNA (cytosine(1962)-C(5))-methyltransferase RlmI, partial [Anaerolineales bacterium]|nr:23S rRNA (cytosine(1962)-C(5))-methyltransferase RlmI [Anaerolineales bacterium]